MAEGMGDGSEFEKPSKASEPFPWKKDWTQVFPNAEKALLEEIIARRSEWTLEICEVSFHDCTKAYTAFLRLFTQQMHIIGRKRCEQVKGAKLYDFVTEERRKFKERKIAKDKARRERKAAKAAQVPALESLAP